MTHTAEESSEFAARLRSARSYAGKTQAEMAEALGVQRPTYAAWEAGQVRLNGFKRRAIATALADFCGLPPEYFSADFELLKEAA